MRRNHLLGNKESYSKEGDEGEGIDAFNDYDSTERNIRFMYLCLHLNYCDDGDVVNYISMRELMCLYAS